MIEKNRLLHQKAILLAFTMALILMGADNVWGQRHSVENVSFLAVDHNVIVIHYDLLAKGKNKKYNVGLFVKQSRNPLLSFKPSALVGDVGTGRFEGRENKIVWSIDHEPEGSFVPSPFIDDYYISVEARRKSSAGWWLFTAALGGAAYFYFTNY